MLKRRAFFSQVVGLVSAAASCAGPVVPTLSKSVTPTSYSEILRRGPAAYYGQFSEYKPARPILRELTVSLRLDDAHFRAQLERIKQDISRNQDGMADEVARALQQSTGFGDITNG